ncbi:MAG TPA: DMT family protein [Candidatus Hydrogenedentes bacterium]|nr:DMT family protein [Candidatus Hydrogenedentota bacterium]
MNRFAMTAVLLSCSNVFMTFAWYGHLKNLSHRSWVIAALVSWGIALFEYLIQVPANRIGHEVMNVGQLKILQEVITLSIFVPFSIMYMREKPSMDYLWAGCCILGAVFFLFRRKLFGA